MYKRILGVAGYVTAASLGAIFVGFLIGAILGAAMTWYNNNYLADAPQGSYIFWSEFIGFYGAVIALPVGSLAGLVIGLSQRSIDYR
jgi:hypothetical protein